MQLITYHFSLFTFHLSFFIFQVSLLAVVGVQGRNAMPA